MPRIFSIATDDATPGTPVVFTFAPKADLKPADLPRALDIVRDIQNTNTTIHQVLTEMGWTDLYPSYASQVRSAAQAALDSDLQDPAFGIFLLEQTRQNFVRNIGQDYRRRYLKRLIQLLGPISVAALVFGTVIDTGTATRMISSLIGPDVAIVVSDENGLLRRLQAICYVAFGICVSVWLSSVLRNRQVEWATLLLFDPNGLTPLVRLGIVSAVAYIFCILLSLGIVTVGVGTNTLNEYIKYSTIATLVGLIAGLSEDSLTKLVLGRVATLTQPAPTATPRP
jgi:hypothetical protein